MDLIALFMEAARFSASLALVASMTGLAVQSFILFVRGPKND